MKNNFLSCLIFTLLAACLSLNANASVQGVHPQNHGTYANLNLIVARVTGLTKGSDYEVLIQIVNATYSEITYRNSYNIYDQKNSSMVITEQIGNDTLLSGNSYQAQIVVTSTTDPNDRHVNGIDFSIK